MKAGEKYLGVARVSEFPSVGGFQSFFLDTSSDKFFFVTECASFLDVW